MPGQTVPQPPQLPAFDVVSTHAPPQAVSGAQGARQVPLEHVSSGPQSLEEQQPRQVDPPQHISFEGHIALSWHVPFEQVLVWQGPLAQSASLQQAWQVSLQS